MVEHERTGPVDLLTLGLSRVTMWGPAVIVGVIIYELVYRYVFVRGTVWANELSLWLAAGVYLTAGLYAMQQRSHIRIFIIYDICPRPVRKAFDIFSTACIWVFAAAMIYGGYGEAWAKFDRWEKFGSAWDPPIPATLKPLILITLALLAVQSLSNLIHDWSKDPESHDPSDDVMDEALVEELRAEAEAEAKAGAEAQQAPPRGA